MNNIGNIQLIFDIGGMISNKTNSSFFEFFLNLMELKFKKDSVKIKYETFYKNISKLETNTIYFLKLTKDSGHWVFLDNNFNVHTSFSNKFRSDNSELKKLENKHNIDHGHQEDGTHGFCQTFAIIYYLNYNYHNDYFYYFSNNYKNNFNLCLNFWIDFLDIVKKNKIFLNWLNCNILNLSDNKFNFDDFYNIVDNLYNNSNDMYDLLW